VQEKTINTPRPHVPVLYDAVGRLADVVPGALWVDCTLGFGGHTRGLLEAGARVVGIDQDAQARARAHAALAPEFGERFEAVAGNFRDLTRLLAELNLGPVDGILADIGVSSWQLDHAERGFSFQRKGPVDMRMNPDAGETAEALIRRLPVGELAGLIRRYGEEPFAGPIARGLRAWVDGAGPHNTATLSTAVANALPRGVAHKMKHNPATRTFQALRIAVNDELGALEALLEAIPEALAPGGRALIISFHSLEDRIVKRAFADWTGKNQPQAPRRGLPRPPAPPALFEALTRKPAMATADEKAENPRARSAKLRAVRKREAT
jgi:16S rRNA (cytosine1402-N4)-methyltransferase